MGYGYGRGWGMMDGWAGYGAHGPIAMIFWLIILIGVVALVVWIVRAVATPTAHQLPPPPRRSTGLDVLDERYSRGEIDRDEYLQKKKDLGG